MSKKYYMRVSIYQKFGIGLLFFLSLCLYGEIDSVYSSYKLENDEVIIGVVSKNKGLIKEEKNKILSQVFTSNGIIDLEKGGWRYSTPETTYESMLYEDGFFKYKIVIKYKKGKEKTIKQMLLMYFLTCLFSSICGKLISSHFT